MSKRYIAEVVITSVEETEPAREPYKTDTTPGRRRKATIARFVVGGQGLLGLVDQVGKHLALVEDGGDINPDGGQR